MSGKVIDLDPTTRITKEILERIKSDVATLDHDDLRSLVLMYKTHDDISGLHVFGIDFETIGFAQAMFNRLADELLTIETTTEEL